MDILNTVAAQLSAFTTASVLVRLLLAALLGGTIGWERGRQGHVAGLRTHILVCLGASMALMVGLFCRYELGVEGDVTRIGAQVISGIGFLGVGTILVRDHTQVTGVTTAAGLWCTAAIGLAVGAGFYWGAILGTGVVMLTMSLLANAEKDNKQSFVTTKVYTELRSPGDVDRLQDALRELPVPFDGFHVCPAHSDTPGHLGVEMTIPINDRALFVEKLRSLDYVAFAVTSD